MTEEIEPALSAEDWEPVLEELAARPADAMGKRNMDSSGYYEVIGATPDANARYIAVNNSALPDSDPRKITRAYVDILRGAAGAIDGEWGIGNGDDPMAVAIERLADALESYLPPETRPCIHCGRDRDHHVADGRCWVQLTESTPIPGKTSFTT